MIIFDNYNTEEQYTDNDIKEMAIDCEWIDNADDITDSMIEEWRQEQIDIEWEAVKAELDNLFDNKTVMFVGTVGRWNGTYAGGKVGDFWDLFNKAMTDCWYLTLEDIKGHLYLTCSHHDGTNKFEIKVLTDKGKQYYENWEYSTDARTEQDCHRQIAKRYSLLPRYAKTVYGV